MRVLVFAPSFAPAVLAGGPARSITNLVVEASTKHDVVVVTADRDLGSNEPFPGLSGRKAARGRATAYYVDVSNPWHWASLIRILKRNPYDLILLNSVWHRTLGLWPAALVALNVLKGPAVLMPRGELEPGALALKTVKKRIGRPAFRSVYRHVVSAVGSTSRSEAEIAGRWFPGVPVLLTSNSPDMIEFGKPAAASSHLRVLTVGRVHPTKGLLPLLKGLRLATEEFQVVSLGPLEDFEYWGLCQSTAADLPDGVGFEHGGVAQRSDLPGHLWNADCMVLLTAGENYGHAIAEALQAGCPVITTPTTPWTEVIRDGGGEIVVNRDDPKEVAAVLDRWAGKAPAELAASRLRARAAFEQFQAASGANIIDLALEAIARRE